MGHVITYRGEMSEPWYRNYLVTVGRWWLIKKGVPLDSIPRTRSNGRWLCVFDDRAVAEELRAQLLEEMEDELWEVAPAEGTPDVGPLQPITVELGRDFHGIGFGLDWFIVQSLRMRYPDAVPHEEVWLKTEQKSTFTKEGIRDFVAKQLPFLTNLTVAQMRSFGGFEVIDPGKQTTVVPFTPFPTVNGAEEPAESATHCEKASSPAHCTSTPPG